MDYINSLPQPFTVRLFGSKNWWPVNDIGVDVPLFRIDVGGLLQVCDFSDAAEFEDAEGKRHDPDDWWINA
jgi:hypothetical protein